MVALTTMVDYSVEQGVAVLTLNNPPVNALSQGVRQGLKEGVEKALADDSASAILIYCEGRTFIAGADISEFSSKPMGPDFHAVLSTMDASAKPIVAAIHGTALGGGLELLLRSDFLYCLDGARFRFPEVTLGFVAAWGGTQLAARLMPFRRAQEMLLLGESISGVQAAEFGLVTGAFATPELLDGHLSSVLERLRYCSPASVQWTKECLGAAWEGSLDLGLDREMEAETETMDSGDFLKGLDALGNGQVYDYSTGKAVAKKSR